MTTLLQRLRDEEEEKKKKREEDSYLSLHVKSSVRCGQREREREDAMHEKGEMGFACCSN